MRISTIKSVLASRRVAIYGSLFAVFGGLYLAHVISAASSCSTDLRSVASPDGTKAVSIEDTLCDSFGGSDEVTISVQTPAGESQVLVFNPSSFSGPADVRWSDSHTVEISIDRVQLIEKRVQASNGVSIHYHIGAIGEPVERPVAR